MNASVSGLKTEHSKLSMALGIQSELAATIAVLYSSSTVHLGDRKVGQATKELKK